MLFAVNMPELLMVPTEESVRHHVSGNTGLPDTVNCWVAPVATLAVAGLTAIAVRV